MVKQSITAAKEVSAAMFAAAVTLTGCGSATVTYTVDGNGTIPADQNSTMTPGANVDSVVFGDDGMYIVCSGGSTCEVTVGDGSGNDDSSTDSHDDNSVVNNDDNSDNSVVNNDDNRIVSIDTNGSGA